MNQQLPLDTNPALIERMVAANLSQFQCVALDEVNMQHMSAHLNGTIHESFAHGFIVSTNPECDPTEGEIAVEYVSGGSKCMLYIGRSQLAACDVKGWFEEYFSLVIEHYAERMHILVEAGQGCKADQRMVALGRTKLQEAFMAFRRSVNPEIGHDDF